VGKPPHLVGEALLKAFGIAPGSATRTRSRISTSRGRPAYRSRVGGFAHLATLVKTLRAAVPVRCCSTAAIRGRARRRRSGRAAQDMVDACKLLGVDVMTGTGSSRYGADRVREIVDGPSPAGSTFVAQNVKTADFGDPVFKPFTRCAR
jgi:sulfur-oxidizing protein SoxB